MHVSSVRAPRAGARWLLAIGLGLLSARVGAEPAAPGWASKTKGLEVRGVSSLRFNAKGDVWYASVQGLGVCRSLDQGATWLACGTGIEAASVRDRHLISLDPKDEKVLYSVVNGRIHKSTDGGAKWEFKGNGTLTYSYDRRQSREWVVGVQVDPGKPTHLLAGTRPRGFYGGLFESDNGGNSWTQIAGTGVDKLSESGLGADAWPIAIDPSSDKYLVVGGTRGLWTSEDRGRHFKRTDPVAVGVHTAYDMTPIRNREVLLAESRGLFRSRDRGVKWGDEPVLPGTCVSVDVDPSNPKRAYAVLRGRGVVHTEDVAKWDAASTKHFELDPHEVVCHPKTKNLVFVTSLSTGLWQSTDRGETFTALPGDVPAVVPGIARVAAHPKDPKRMLAVTDSGTVFLSQDAGEAWTRVGNLGVPVTRLLGDPSSPSAWFATGPEVYATEDSGTTWKSVKAPIDVEDRAVDAQLVADGLLVVWERDGRVESTKDRGASWGPPSARPTASTGSWVSSLAVDPADPKHWLVALRSLRETWSKDDPDGGCYETRDAGTTWAKVEVTGVESGNQGVAVAIDHTGTAWYVAEGAGVFRRDAAKDAPWADVTPAAAPKPWWAAAFVVARAGADAVDVLFQAESADASVRTLLRSADGGRTWAAMEDTGGRITSIAADPSTPGRYLAGDLTGGRGVLIYGTSVPTPPTPPEPPPPGPTPPKPPEGAHAPALDGLLGIAATAQGAQVLDLRDGKVVGTLGHSGEVLAVAVSRDGTRLFTGGADRAVGVWERGAVEPKAFLRGAEGAVAALAVSPDGSRLYAGDNQWTIVVWDVAAAKEAGRLSGHTGAVTALALSADGARLASASADGTVRVWDVAAGKESAKTPAHDGEVRALALSPDGATVFAGSRSPVVRSYDAATGAAKGTFDVGIPEVLALALSPDGSTLYAAGAGEEVAAFEAADGKPSVRHGGAAGPVLALAVAPDGKSVAAGGADGSVRVWDAGAATARGTWPTTPKGPVLGLALAGLAPAAPPAPPTPPAPPAEPPAPAGPGSPPPAEPPPGDPPAKR